MNIKNFIINISLFMAVVFVTTACNKEGNDDEVTLPAPELVSSSLKNGAVNIPVGDLSIVLTFNQNVTSPSAGHSSVTLEGAEVTSIKANLKEVTILISGLVLDCDYSLIIPKGVILGPTKVPAEEIVINFSTIKSTPVGPVKSELCTPNASSQAKNVYAFLIENYSKNIISSTIANVNWNINEAEWVYQHTGKYPAMNCFDYIHLFASPSNWIDYTNTSVVEDWWNRNGLVAAMWHWNVPKQETSASDDVTCNPEETVFRPTQALTEGTWQNKILKADLKKVADCLRLLQNKNIPVIWRPLHEAAGNIYEYTGGTAWFWWGADGAEAFKSLWIYMFDFFKNEGINNLIWVWTAQGGDNAFYPGDDYVDIIGRDLYNITSVTQIQQEYAELISNYPGKLVTLSECGNIPDIENAWQSGAQWSWFMPWYDYERTDNVADSDFGSAEHGHANAAWWEKAVNAENVITLDKMPSLK